MSKVFVATGENVLIERGKNKNDTVMGRVISSGDPNFVFGDIVLYKDRDCDNIIIQNGLKADIIWSQKIRCKMIEKETN